LPNSTAYNLLEACRKSGCPICNLEQESAERYLDNHFYENVNSPAWRDRLRSSLGFCHEHAWLGVNQRLGDALGFAMIYRDVIETILRGLDAGSNRTPPARRWAILPGQNPDQAQSASGRMLSVLQPSARCPACERRDETTHTLLSVLAKELQNAEMTEALQASDGLCLPHLQLTLKYVKEVSVSEMLLDIHQAKLRSLSAELAEFIRKNDYQLIEHGFGREGDAWLRAIAMVTGNRKKG
jgi:hypothetical protein